jgi:hypothetical protein
MVQLRLVHINAMIRIAHSAQGSGTFMSLFENVMKMTVFTKIQSRFPLPYHIVILNLPSIYRFTFLHK